MTYFIPISAIGAKIDHCCFQIKHLMTSIKGTIGTLDARY